MLIYVVKTRIQWREIANSKLSWFSNFNLKKLLVELEFLKIRYRLRLQVHTLKLSKIHDLAMLSSGPNLYFDALKEKLIANIIAQQHSRKLPPILASRIQTFWLLWLASILPDNACHCKDGVCTMHSELNCKLCTLCSTVQCAANFNVWFRMPISMGLTN